MFEKSKRICMKNPSPKFPSYAVNLAFAFGGVPALRDPTFCGAKHAFLLEGALEASAAAGMGQVFPALGEAARSHAAVTVQRHWSELMQSGQRAAEGAGADVPAHRALPAKFTGSRSGNCLGWHRA